MTLAMNFANWGIPQWTYMGLMLLNLCINIAQDGKPRRENRYSASSAFVGFALGTFLLAAGGFFA